MPFLVMTCPPVSDRRRASRTDTDSTTAWALLPIRRPLRPALGQPARRDIFASQFDLIQPGLQLIQLSELMRIGPLP
jgi:hypothetical protein